jgi:hypothetical protein
MIKNHVSLEKILEVACSISHPWLKRNRSKGLRYIITGIYTKGIGSSEKPRANFMTPALSYRNYLKPDSNIRMCMEVLKDDIYGKSTYDDPKLQLAQILVRLDEFEISDVILD